MPGLIQLNPWMWWNLEWLLVGSESQIRQSFTLRSFSFCYSEVIPCTGSHFDDKGTQLIFDHLVAKLKKLFDSKWPFPTSEVDPSRLV